MPVRYHAVSHLCRVAARRNRALPSLNRRDNKEKNETHLYSPQQDAGYFSIFIPPTPCIILLCHLVDPEGFSFRLHPSNYLTKENKQGKTECLQNTSTDLAKNFIYHTPAIYYYFFARAHYCLIILAVKPHRL